MDKWEQLRLLIEATVSHNVQYSYDKNVEHHSYKSVLKWMDDLDKREKKHLEETNAFLFTDIPEFDKKAWERILEERGIQGLA